MTDLKQQIESVVAFNKNYYKDKIDEWILYWMNQTQNNEQDYQNYLRRAMGVDANMRHHLASMLAKDKEPLLGALAECAVALEKLKYNEKFLPNCACHTVADPALANLRKVLGVKS